MCLSPEKYKQNREQMILRLREKGIEDERVLKAMSEIPRHLFLDAPLSSRAYDDGTPPIGNGQTMSSPYTVALLCQLAKLEPGFRILEVGTGSGYQAAVMSRLCEKVFTLERCVPFVAKAKKIFHRLNINNVVAMRGDGTTGLSRFAPYSAIVVTAGGAEIPKLLGSQLADGARMIVPVGSNGEQIIHIVKRTGERYKVAKSKSCNFVPLIADSFKE